MTNQIPTLGWLDEIALNSKYSIEDVRTVIQKYEIQQSPNKGIPKHLHIIEVKFSGIKEGIFTNEFNFIFENLNHGIFGIISDNNFKGKTTVLEVIKWLLRGSNSSLLQDGVKKWIKKASLKFEIDEVIYSVEMEHSQNEVKGKLFKILTDDKNTIADFYSNDEFESCMSDFMIKQFSLDKLSAFRNSKIKEEIGKKVSHNWSSLASVLFISTDYNSLFGDIVLDGLSNRLMNMYLGLPWISTYTALKTVESQIKSENKVEDIYLNRELDRKRTKFQDIIEELKEKEELIKTFPSDKEVYDKLNTSRENYSYTSRQITSLDQYLRKLTEEYNEIKEIKDNDKIKIINLKEDRAAHAVFKKLNPTCCPHCESIIDKKKIEKEKTNHHCAICDSAMLESEDSEVLLNELELNLNASEKTFNEVQREYKKQTNNYSQLNSTLLSLQRQINHYESEINRFSERHKIDEQIKRLYVLKEEYTTDEEKPIKYNNISKTINESEIIRNAIEVTKRRFVDLQTELLEEVSDEILRISKHVGLGNIEKVILTATPHLKLQKDGSSTSYSKCSEGEKLRLKVITTIALLSVAEKKKVGRHPGLLLIDSPGAQEVSDHDLNSLIEGLKKLTNELPFLQIIIASRVSNVILNQIEEEQRKYAKGDDFLW